MTGRRERPKSIARAAVFSDCGAYRYRLFDLWDPALPAINWLMLNPSTADECRNDPTIERCQRRAVAWGYGAIDITNLFALRSTDPGALYGHADPVGEDNDRAILDAARSAALVVCGWGTHGALHGRGRAVLGMLEAAGVRPLALRVLRCGNPGHPLYIPYSTTPEAVKRS